MLDVKKREKLINKLISQVLFNHCESIKTETLEKLIDLINQDLIEQ